MINSMFNVREVPWYGQGNPIDNAPNSSEAIKQAGLEWTVDPKPIYFEHLAESFLRMNEDFRMIPNMFANVRSDNQQTLGVVSGRYNLIQNIEAFDFMDTVVGRDGLRYDSAGSFGNGKRVWMLARLESSDTKILGDEVESYLLLTNSHDGKGAIKVAVTPIRLLCANMINLAIKDAHRSWTTKHTGDFQSKIIDAQKTLEMTTVYMKALNDEAEQLVKKVISFDTFKAISEQLFPIDPDATARQIKTVKTMREGLEYCFGADDIHDFRETAWGVVNAVSDFVSHRQAKRMTKTYEERRFQSVADGSTIFDRAYQLVKSA